MTINGQRLGLGGLSKVLSEVLLYDGLLNTLHSMKHLSERKLTAKQEGLQNIIDVQGVVESFLALKYKSIT